MKKRNGWTGLLALCGTAIVIAGGSGVVSHARSQNSNPLIEALMSDRSPASQNRKSVAAITPDLDYAIRSLGEAQVLGDRLLTEFDQSGDLKSPAYAKLMALHAVRESLVNTVLGHYRGFAEAMLTFPSGSSQAQWGAEGMTALNETLGSAYFQTFTQSPKATQAISDLASELESAKSELAELTRHEVSGVPVTAEIARISAESEVSPDGAGELLDPSDFQARSPDLPSVSEWVESSYADFLPEAAESYGPSLPALLDLPDSSALTWAPGPGPQGTISGNERKLELGTWALTFDDGPHGTYSQQILANLAKHDLKATFFELAMQVKLYPQIALELSAAGHEMANHSWTHPQLQKLGPAALNHEVHDSTVYETQVLGKKPLFFRNPYGAGIANNSKPRIAVANEGMIQVFWNVDTLDWQDKNPESIFQRAIKQMSANGKGVILFHDIHPQSVIASEKVMAWLKENSKNAVTMRDVLSQLNSQP